MIMSIHVIIVMSN